MNYIEFLESKRHTSNDFGFDVNHINPMLYDFQSELVQWALKKGRAAIFADCGLGKTPMQLEWAKQIVERENNRVLILTPLAVAGAYSANNVITVLDNMREGMRLATEVFRAGFAPFCPWLDFHFQLMLRDGERLTINDYYEYSIAYLEVSDGLILVPKWQNSTGTKNELKIADTLGLPVFECLEFLKSYFKRHCD